MIPERPEDWGRNELGQFLLTAEQNAIATYANMRPLYDRLLQIDRLYRSLIAGLSDNPQWFAGFFLLRTHSAFLGACRTSLSGQIPETFMILRGCLESALYGLYISHDPQRAEIWLRRHDDKEARDRVRSEFTPRRMLACLADMEPPLRDRAKDLYDICIDYGAHPNERAFTSNILTRHHEAATQFTMAYLNVLPAPLLFGLSETARVGVCGLEVFGSVFSELYSKHCQSTIEELKRRLYATGSD